MSEKKKRPYQYRERPYNYRENLIREESRSRKIRKQLVLTSNEYSIIQSKMNELKFDNFSEYIRYCLYNNSLTKEKVANYDNNEKNSQRKQICFNDEEIMMIKNAMDELEMNNFNLYIKLIAM